MGNLTIPDHIKTLDDLESSTMYAEIEGVDVYLHPYWREGQDSFEVGASVWDAETHRHIRTACRTGISANSSDKDLFKIAISQMNRAIIRAREALKESK